MPACAVVGCVDGEGASHFDTRFIGSILAEENDIAIVTTKPATGENLPRVELCIQLDAGQLSLTPGSRDLILAQFLDPADTRYGREYVLKSTKWLGVGCGNHHIKVIGGI